MKIENWCGYDIRFVEIDGEWWAILKDIGEALGYSNSNINYIADNFLSEDVLKKTNIEDKYEFVINELGIYKLILDSKCPEAHKFKRWSASVMQKLRKCVGLESYEIMKMMEPDIQDKINYILDSLYFDEENNMIMQSVTIQGGDVEQIPFK